MLLRQFCRGNDLQIHTGENTDFLWQKPWHLQSPKANFEG